jgi:hypothetical protein
MSRQVGDSSSLKRMISHPSAKRSIRRKRKGKPSSVLAVVTLGMSILLALLLQHSVPASLQHQQELLRSPIQSKIFTTVATAATPISNHLKDLRLQTQDVPWRVIIAHEPRYDLLRSFVLPTLFLYAVASYHTNHNEQQHQHEQLHNHSHTIVTDTWELRIFPFAGSQQHTILKQLFGLKENVTGL